MDLSAFHMTDGNFVQIVLTGFTLLYVLLDDLIGRRRPVQACSRVSLLPTRFLLAFLAQTFPLVREPIRRGRQTAIVAVFRLSLLQCFYLLGQTPYLFLHLLRQDVLLVKRGFQLLDPLITLRQLFVQERILFSQMHPFFFDRHTLTLLDLSSFDKPLLT